MNLRMSRRTYESGSGKQKKVTAKADALRAVIEKSKAITKFFRGARRVYTRRGHVSGVPEATPGGSFLRFSFEPGAGAGVKSL